VLRFLEALRSILGVETKAYGFTLVVWGTGSLTEAQRGKPGRLDVVAFVGGALVALTLVILVAFGGPRAPIPTRVRQRRHALGAVHVVSVSIAMACGWVVALVVTDTALSYLGASATAVLAYQLVVGLEGALSTDRSEGA